MTESKTRNNIKLQHHIACKDHALLNNVKTSLVIRKLKNYNTTTTNPVYSHIVRSGEDKMYAVHTSTSKEVERLFPIYPRLDTRNTKQIHSKAWNKMA